MGMVAIQVVGLTCDMLGTVLIAYTALRVHDRVRKEHAIDSVVENAMETERRLGIIGVALVVIGFLIQVILIV